ncbi:serine O-acetyltransferase [Lacinutrix sp. Bg11-31]|uniref:serine O-acetyltransferase n=1 Tax=Lacinutrix sp. Bg11-31 TaxID=2057808 RepID=UPI000C3135C0|nr:serine acetyltransferase [Lacinutrix sp. Bg11-31]AUC82064.1 serine acetyltransferase [Lacinutrix sp. Bg11-31]
MSDSSLKHILGEDLKRYGLSSKPSFFSCVKQLLFYTAPGVKFSIVFRSCQHYRGRNKVLFYFFFLYLRRIKHKYGFDISYRTSIGKGLYLGHFGGVVIHGDATIGEYCNISQGITIGVLNRGKYKGVPKIGDSIFIGPNAVIVGGISIGNNVLIGANSLVNFNVKTNAVVAPTPSQIISYQGSKDYV